MCTVTTTTRLSTRRPPNRLDLYDEIGVRLFNYVFFKIPTNDDWMSTPSHTRTVMDDNSDVAYFGKCRFRPTIWQRVNSRKRARFIFKIVFLTNPVCTVLGSYGIENVYWKSPTHSLVPSDLFGEVIKKKNTALVYELSAVFD